MSTIDSPGCWDSGTWVQFQPVYQPQPPCPFAPKPTWGTDYQPELRRIADALERLANRPAIGFSVPRRCIVCERMGMQDGFILGYGSVHDGFWVCDDCIHRLVDEEVVRLEES